MECRDKFQGMPPLQDDATRNWINGLLVSGQNFLAWQDDMVVGHVAVLPDHKKRDAEYLIFVSHPHRGRGIGSELTRAAIKHLKDLGIQLIWLVVGTGNLRAIGLYKKFGFVFADADFRAPERLMKLRP